VGLVHRSCGRASNRAWDEEEKRKILERYSERYAGYGPTFTVEKLGGDGYGVDHETLRRWLIREGLWQKRRRRKEHLGVRPLESRQNNMITFLGVLAGCSSSIRRETWPA